MTVGLDCVVLHWVVLGWVSCAVLCCIVLGWVACVVLCWSELVELCLLDWVVLCCTVLHFVGLDWTYWSVTQYNKVCPGAHTPW